MTEQEHIELRRALNRVTRQLRQVLPEGYEYVLSISGPADEEGKRYGYHFSNMSKEEQIALLSRMVKLKKPE